MKTELCQYCFGAEELETMDAEGNVALQPCPACSGHPASQGKESFRKAMDAAEVAVEGVLGEFQTQRRSA